MSAIKKAKEIFPIISSLSSPILAWSGSMKTVHLILPAKQCTMTRKFHFAGFARPRWDKTPLFWLDSRCRQVRHPLYSLIPSVRQRSRRVIAVSNVPHFPRHWKSLSEALSQEAPLASSRQIPVTNGSDMQNFYISGARQRARSSPPR